MEFRFFHLRLYLQLTVFFAISKNPLHVTLRDLLDFSPTQEELKEIE